MAHYHVPPRVCPLLTVASCVDDLNRDRDSNKGIFFYCVGDACAMWVEEFDYDEVLGRERAVGGKCGLVVIQK